MSTLAKVDKYHPVAGYHHEVLNSHGKKEVRYVNYAYT
jgi:hypothetical protein